MKKRELCAAMFVVAFLESNRVSSDQCECYNEPNFSNKPLEPLINCYCKEIDENMLLNISSKVNMLTITKSDIQFIKSDAFVHVEQTVTDISLDHLDKLQAIENGTFDNCYQLLSLCISDAPLLHNISLPNLEIHNSKLRVLRIFKTGLKYVPKIKAERHQIFDIVDFEYNKLTILTTNGLEIKADRVTFGYNMIESVEGWAFNNSHISKLSLKGNRQLQLLIEDAFQGISNLQVLDLSDTSISFIPSYGIRELELLIVKNAPLIKTVPSIYDFEALQEVRLTHAFHCCAFQLPERHNPERYAAHQVYIRHMETVCKFGKKAPNNWQSTELENNENNEGEFWHDTDEGHTSGSAEKFHEEPLQINISQNLLVLCGLFYMKKEPVRCAPVPNAFNPCEDIMGYEWLRICVWLVSVTALLGNFCVLSVIFSKPRDISTQSFLVANLAISDFCMALYLTLLAVQDFISKGYYFNYAFNWQEGIGCKIAGFLTIFASQLSIFVMCLLTMERWYSINRALYTNQLNFQLVALITAFGWLYAIMMAALPLIGISTYSTTSLCLPMSTEKTADFVYILTLLLISVCAFFLICACYIDIYFSLSYDTRHKDGEYRLAKKIMLLVSTNFMCWTPISFLALTAIFGYPLITITNSKILLVFFYPINSCANPFLYAILTSSFKGDFLNLLARIGINTKSDRDLPLPTSTRQQLNNLSARLSTSHTRESI